MTGRDWNKARDRTRVARQGSEPIDGAGVLHGPPGRRKPKSELRGEIAAASMVPGAMIAKALVCRRCGRRKTVTISLARLGARFKCSVCGEVTT